MTNNLILKDLPFLSKYLVHIYLYIFEYNLDFDELFDQLQKTKFKSMELPKIFSLETIFSNFETILYFFKTFYENNTLDNNSLNMQLIGEEPLTKSSSKRNKTIRRKAAFSVAVERKLSKRN